MSGTLPADTLVLEKDAQEGVNAGFFPPLAPSSLQLPSNILLSQSATIEKSRIQVENVEDQLIDIISRYWTCVFLVPLWIPYLLLRILLSCIFCIVFDKLLYFLCGLAMTVK